MLEGRAVRGVQQPLFCPARDLMQGNFPWACQMHMQETEEESPVLPAHGVT